MNRGGVHGPTRVSLWLLDAFAPFVVPGTSRLSWPVECQQWDIFWLVVFLKMKEKQKEKRNTNRKEKEKRKEVHPHEHCKKRVSVY